MLVPALSKVCAKYVELPPMQGTVDAVLTRFLAPSLMDLFHQIGQDVSSLEHSSPLGFIVLCL